VRWGGPSGLDHLTRTPAAPPHPRLLQTSWHAVQPALREALRSLPTSQPGLAPEVAALNSMAHKLDDAVSSSSGSAGGPREAWSLYRRILGAYSHFGSFPEAAWAPATPRDGASSTGSSVHATPRGHDGGAGSSSTSGAAAR
jgi:hypothetical protein